MRPSLCILNEPLHWVQSPLAAQLVPASFQESPQLNVSASFQASQLAASRSSLGLPHLKAYTRARSLFWPRLHHRPRQAQVCAEPLAEAYTPADPLLTTARPLRNGVDLISVDPGEVPVPAIGEEAASARRVCESVHKLCRLHPGTGCALIEERGSTSNALAALPSLKVSADKIVSLANLKDSRRAITLSDNADDAASSE